MLISVNKKEQKRHFHIRRLRDSPRYKESVEKHVGATPFLCTWYLLTENWQGKLKGRFWLPDKQFSIPIDVVKTISPEKVAGGDTSILRVFLDVDWCVAEYYWLKGYLNVEPEKSSSGTCGGAKISLI